MKTISITLFTILFAGIIHAQSLVDVTPDTARQNDNVTLTVTGSNTTFTQGSYSLFLESPSNIIPAGNVNIVSNTVLEANYSFSAFDDVGLYNVVLFNMNNASTLELPQSFELLPASGGGGSQSLVSFSPDEANIGDTITHLIKGSSTTFATDDTNIVVLDNGSDFIEPEQIQVIDDETISATFIYTQIQDTGYYDLIYAGDMTGTTPPLYLGQAFRLKGASGNSPSLTSVSPDEGRIGDTLTLTIHGSNTTFTSDDTTLIALDQSGSGTSLEPDHIQVIDDETIEAEFRFDQSLNTGTYDLFYLGDYNDPNKLRILNSAFELKPKPGTVPEITEVTPDQAHRGETVTLTVSTVQTDFTQATNTPSSYLQNTQGVMINPDTTIIIDSTTLESVYTFTTNDPLGDYNCNVFLPDEHLMLVKNNAFTLLWEPGEEDILTGISPDNAKKGDNVTLSIAGSNTAFTQGYNSVWLKQDNEIIHPNNIQPVNDDTVNANFTFASEHKTGMYDVLVLNNGQNPYELTSGFQLKKPSGINSADKKQSMVAVYPNPSTDGRFILSKASNDAFDVMVTDINNRIIARNRMNKQEQQIELDLSENSAGHYLLILQNNEQRLTKKLIITGNR